MQGIIADGASYTYHPIKGSPMAIVKVAGPDGYTLRQYMLRKEGADKAIAFAHYLDSVRP